MHKPIFEKVATKDKFQEKLQQVIELIKKNQSLVAKKALDVINTNEVNIFSFFQISKPHYKYLAEKYSFLPLAYPPSAEVVHQLENIYDGLNCSNSIYLSSTTPLEIMAITLIHEISHYLNVSLLQKDRKVMPSRLAEYRDETRAYTAERMFKRKGRCLMRSEMKKIHQKIAKLYPELVTSGTEKVGYVYSVYDVPAP